MENTVLMDEMMDEVGKELVHRKLTWSEKNVIISLLPEFVSKKTVKELVLEVCKRSKTPRKVRK